MSSNTTASTPDFQQGKKSCLWHLAKENAIVIPIIQRDYAQGRSNDDVRQIRKPFLKALLRVLDSDNGKQELDFIYGSLERPKDISLRNVDYENFVPLDGQQRLTTLFLLHWFLAIWNESSFRLLRRHFTGRFSYMTRMSSSEFCTKILENVSSKDVVKSIQEGGKNPISRMLADEGWFHDQWRNDPTISGMLTMLDTISRLFDKMTNCIDREAKAKACFRRLICKDVEDVAITFNLLYLNKGDFRLSDELYIKMNSRGKPLSDFETFKARFESFMAKNTIVNKDFAGSIDGKWADVFWNMRNNIRPKTEEDKRIYYRDNTDGMMMNIIKVALANRYAILADNNDGSLDELFESQVARKANPNMHLTFYRYSELGVFNEFNDKEAIEDKELERRQRINQSVCQGVYDVFSFIHALKSECADKYKVREEFMNVEEQLNNIMFYGVDGKNSRITDISYQTRLLFWTLSEYCTRYRNDIVASTDKCYLPLNRWMRFVRNMAESTEINGVSDMQKALKFMDSTLTAMVGGDIISYLANLGNAPECTPFPQSQIKEEILKARLITCNGAWEDSIKEADNVPSWPGRSGYLLYFSGLSEMSYESLKELDERQHADIRDHFDIYKQKMDAVLKYINGSNYQTECLLERALLSKGCYLRKEDKGSIIYSMMDQSVFQRSYSFRQLVQYNGIDCSNDNTMYKEGVECLKGVLDDALFCYSTVEEVSKSLSDIINTSVRNVQDWRRPLLENPILWHEAWDRFMWIEGGLAWVVRKKGGSTNQYETWAYHLQKVLEGEGLKFGYYARSKPRYTILNFNVEAQRYQLRIRHTSTGKWRFEMLAVDEFYQPIIEMSHEMRKVIFSLMPSGTSAFVKDNIADTVLWAKAMQSCISKQCELL